ncbi:MAG: histone deacetylase [Gammaproteobacteria bacterium]|nr:histone deacetylase [Gammaproteobacteria bacterium]MDH5800442.1 histone deacetylase [Gammaproteobacteria bacterium]
MPNKFIFSKKYDFSLLGFDKLHPFDGKKYSKAWNLLQADYGSNLKSELRTELRRELSKALIEPTEPIAPEQLLSIHTQQYLDSLSSSKVIAQVLEVGAVSYLPNKILQNSFLKPARLAVSGTVEAATQALTHDCIAVNIGGGFHHAFPDHGEGFSFFADAALSIEHCRSKGLISATDNILMIDLDAHRGNGFEFIYAKDPRVHMLDMYNFQVYPGIHPGEPKDFPYLIPLKAYSNTDHYLNTLQQHLPEFLNSVEKPKLAFYNAGTDILDQDPLGGLRVSYDGVVERDQTVLKALHDRKIPTVVMTSGGYSKDSYKLIADMCRFVVGLDS